MSKRARFLLNGRLISKTEAIKKPITVIGPESEEEGIALSFDSDPEFHKWADHSAHAERFRRVELLTSEWRERRSHVDHARLQRLLRVRLDRVVDDLSSVAAELGLNMETQGFEVFRKATVERDLMEPQIFDPTILFARRGLQGSWLPLLTMLGNPDFGWFNFDKKASSLAVVGSGFLWQDNWFTGSRLLFYSHTAVSPLPAAINLDWIGWDNRASSGMAA